MSTARVATNSYFIHGFLTVVWFHTDIQIMKKQSVAHEWLWENSAADVHRQWIMQQTAALLEAA